MVEVLNDPKYCDCVSCNNARAYQQMKTAEKEKTVNLLLAAKRVKEKREELFAAGNRLDTMLSDIRSVEKEMDRLREEVLEANNVLMGFVMQ